MSHTSARQAVLVTGGTGFIGMRLVRRLVERHDRVICLVRSAPGAGNRSEELRSIGAELAIGDVTDRESVQRAMRESRVGTVFHLAGLVRARNEAEFMRVNRDGVNAIAGACADLDQPPALVVVSSLAAAGPSVGDRSRSEQDEPSPVSSYGRSKLAGERAAAAHAGDVPITIVRPPIVFGPGDRAVLEVFRPIARWGIHFVPGRHGGDRRVSLVHVDDVVEGLLLAADKGERLSEGGPVGKGVYFVAGEDRLTYADLGRTIAAALGRTPPVVVRVPGLLLGLLAMGGDLMSLVRGRAGWINSDKMAEALAVGSWTCSSERARSHFGWSPAQPLSDRLGETARWYREAGWL